MALQGHCTERDYLGVSEMEETGVLLGEGPGPNSALEYTKEEKRSY